MNRSGRLEALASAIADRSTIDWTAAERALQGTLPHRPIGVLRALSRASTSRMTAVADPPHEPVLRATAGAAGGVVALQIALALLSAASGSVRSSPLPSAAPIVAMLAFAIAAFALRMASRRDERALYLAACFACLASSSAQPLLAASASEVGFLTRFATALLPETLFPGLLWTFTREFPRVVRFGRGASLVEPMRRASFAVGALLLVVNLLHRVHALPESTIREIAPLLRDSRGIYWATLALLALPAVAVALLRVRDAPSDERERVQFFVGGLAIGFGPLFLQILLEALIPAYDRFTDVPAHHRAFGLVLYGFLLTIPLTTAYAVAARQLFDIRSALGRAARFTLARGTLGFVAGTSIVALVVLTWSNREDTFAELLGRSDSMLWLGILLLGAALLPTRRQVLRVLEDRLLGKAVEARTALARFNRSIGPTRDPAQVAALARRELEACLRCDHVSLFVADSPSAPFRDVESRMASLSHDGALAALLGASPAPIRLDDESSSSVLALLPAVEFSWARTTGFDYLVPLTPQPSGTGGFLAVGPPRTGLSLTAEELSWIEVAVGAISNAIHRDEPIREARPDPAGTECVDCGAIGPTDARSCICGGPVEPAALPATLLGKFRCDRLLGRGGMGVVYRAVDLALGRTVALKTLPRLEWNALARLRKEAKSMASVVHPNLATIYGVETWRGVPVLVVEYLAGGTLADRLNGPMPAAQVIELGIALATALEAMHQRSILHRDLKPSNIGFDERDQVKLLDFGLAKLFDEGGDSAFELNLPPRGPGTSSSATGSRHVVGTVRYLSPEALRGAPATPGQDLWALFLVLLEALTGGHPLGNLSQTDAVARLERADILTAVAALRETPPELAALLHRGLSTDRARRPSSAADVRRDLEQIRIADAPPTDAAVRNPTIIR